MDAKDFTYGILGQSEFPAPVSELELNEIKKKHITDMEHNDNKKKRANNTNCKSSPAQKSGGKVKSVNEKRKRDTETAATAEWPDSSKVIHVRCMSRWLALVRTLDA